jgi:phosphatidylinositol N-acetylglucosaminyltransferase subunit Q
LALFTYDLYDSRPLEILGILTYEDSRPKVPKETPWTKLKLEAAIDKTSWIPKLTFYDSGQGETQIILFSPPNPHGMQFFSLTPITLDLAASGQGGRQRADSIIERDDSETARMDDLVKKVGFHFPRHPSQPIQGSEILTMSIDQVYLF